MDYSSQINYQGLGQYVDIFKLEMQERAVVLGNMIAAAKFLKSINSEIQIKQLGYRCDSAINNLNNILINIEKLDPKEGARRFDKLDDEVDSIDRAIQSMAISLEASLRIHGQRVTLNRTITHAAIGAGLLYYLKR